MRLLAACLLIALLPGIAHARLDSAWRSIPERVPTDSIADILRGWEQHPAAGVRPGEAGYALGQFYYARGEYAVAAGAYSRAATRLEGEERAAARYGWALAMFALGRASAAREAFDEVSQSNGPARSLAMLGAAQCWEAEGHPEKAFDILQRLLATEAGEATPAALERFAALSSLMHREREAGEARRRLVRAYPRSIEAARALGAPLAAPRARAAGERPETGVTTSRHPAP